jgi:hypothetical protein
MSDIEDRKAFSNFLLKVIQDFERTIAMNKDHHLILNKIYFGCHYHRDIEKAYIEIEDHEERVIRVVSYISDDVVYSEPNHPIQSYDLKELCQDLFDFSPFDKDVFEEIMQYVYVNSYTKHFEVYIFNEKTEESYFNSTMFSLDATQINQFHDFLFKEIVISASHLVIPYSNLLEFIIGILNCQDEYQLDRRRFIEVIEITIPTEFQYESIEDAYITHIDIIFDIFRDNHWDGPSLERRIEAKLFIHQDPQRFPIQIIWNESSTKGDFTHILKSLLHHIVNEDKPKPMLSYRQIEEFIEDKFIHN